MSFVTKFNSVSKFKLVFNIPEILWISILNYNLFLEKWIEGFNRSMSPHVYADKSIHQETKDDA